MIIYRIIILTIFSLSCFCTSLLNAQTRPYQRTARPVNTQNRYIDQRRMSGDKQAKVKNENKQLKNQLKNNQREYNKLLKELEKAQKEADLCNSYVATPTYDNSNTAQLQTQSNTYDDFDYEEDVDYGNTQVDYGTFEEYSTNTAAPKNTLKEQQMAEIKVLEQTLAERKETQAKQEAQLAELNKKIDAMLSK